MNIKSIISQIEESGNAVDFIDDDGFRNSMDWYLQKVNKIQEQKFDPKTETKKKYLDTTMLGNLYIFMYIPRNAKKLKYYDQFPLVLPIQKISKSKTHFLGLNLHYLPTAKRLFFFNKLKKFENFDKYQEPKIIMTYEFLKSSKFLKEYSATIKRYNLRRIQSKFVKIDPKEWETSILLPSYKFINSDTSTVWKESEEKIK